MKKKYIIINLIFFLNTFIFSENINEKDKESFKVLEKILFLIEEHSNFEKNLCLKYNNEKISSFNENLFKSNFKKKISIKNFLDFLKEESLYKVNEDNIKKKLSFLLLIENNEIIGINTNSNLLFNIINKDYFAKNNLKEKYKFKISKIRNNLLKNLNFLFFEKKIDYQIDSEFKLFLNSEFYLDKKNKYGSFFNYLLDSTKNQLKKIKLKNFKIKLLKLMQM